MAAWSPATDGQTDYTKKPKRRRRSLPFSYSIMITQAILSSINHQMTLRDIYLWISTRYPNLYSDSETGWQNTIRHNLSLNRIFKKVPRQDSSLPGKGGYWTIDFQYFDYETFRQKSCVESTTSGGDRYSTTAYTTRPPMQRALLGQLQYSLSSCTSNMSSTSSLTSSPPNSMRDFLSSPGQMTDKQADSLENDSVYDSDSRSTPMSIESLLN
ncbi:unnamed protein product [Umbelopsis ramanniana]